MSKVLQSKSKPCCAPWYFGSWLDYIRESIILPKSRPTLLLVTKDAEFMEHNRISTWEKYFILMVKKESVAHSSQMNYTGQPDSCNWQHYGNIRLVLRSFKSINVDFIIQIRYISIKKLISLPHGAGWTSNRPNPFLMLMVMLFKKFS